MKFYSYDELARDVAVIGREIKDDFNPECIVAIARGGLSFGHAIANALNLRQIVSINSIHYDDTKKLDTIEVFNIPDLSKFSRVLLTDDIIDSGDSMVEIYRILKEMYPNVDIRIAVIFYKDRAKIKPHYKVAKTEEWINFYWENFSLDV